MYIFIITKYKHPHVGGVEKHVYETSKILSKKHTLKIISSDNLNPPAGGKNIKFLGLILIWIQLIKLIKIIQRADVVHIHDVFIWYLPYRFLFPKKKVVLTMHGWEGIYPVPIKNILIKRVGAFLSNDVISVGKYIDKYYGTKSDYFIYGGVNQPNTQNKKLKTINLITFIGRLEKDTGLTILLNAAEVLIKKGYKIQFLGDGELKDECQKYGEVLGFKKNISIYLNKSKYVFASGYLSILESLAHQNIVIAAYDNQLKKDYYQMSPFKNYINLIKNGDELIKNIHNLRHKNPQKLFDELNWEEIVVLYETIYQ